MALPRWPPAKNLLYKREEKLRTLFKAYGSQPQLEVIRVLEGRDQAGNENELCIELENVSDSSRLKELSQVCCTQSGDSKNSKGTFLSQLAVMTLI